MHAYCFASGQIEFGARVPEGALPIAKGARESLVDFISGFARHGYGRDTLLVPGIPEALGNQDEALDALKRWTKWIGKSAPRGIEVVHSKHHIRRAARQALGSAKP